MSALGWLESSPTTVNEVTCILILTDELHIEVYRCVRITQFWFYKTTLDTVDCRWIWFIYTSYSGLLHCSFLQPYDWTSARGVILEDRDIIKKKNSNIWDDILQPNASYENNSWGIIHPINSHNFVWEKDGTQHELPEFPSRSSVLIYIYIYIYMLFYMSCFLWFTNCVLPSDDINLIPGCLWLLAFVLNNTLILGICCSLIPHLPGCFCPWAFFHNIGFNMVPSYPLMSHLATQLGYSAGEFQALQLIVLATFGVVD